MNPDYTADITPNLDYSRHVLVEFSDLLGQLRQLTMTAVEQSSDPEALARLIECVSQAHNTFQLIECSGAELLCSELLALLDAVQRGTVDAGFDTAPVLVLASEKLTEYIDYLLAGAPDLPLALLPLVNNMRACRGVNLLSEALIVAPHFSVPSNIPLRNAATTASELNGLATYRLSLMKHLLEWFAKPGRHTASALATDFSAIDQLCSDTELSSLFAAAESLSVSLADGGLDSSPAIKLLLGQLERYVHALNQFATAGAESGLKAVMDLALEGAGDTTIVAPDPTNGSADGIPFPSSLFRNLLYYLALSESPDQRVVSLKQRYRLPELLPPKASLELARTALGGPGATLSEAICNSVSKELGEVKIALESCRSVSGSVLKQVKQQLKQVTYTLLLLDLHEARRLNLRAIDRIGLAEKTNDIRLLQAVAADLLLVFAALDEYQHGKRQTVIFADNFETLAGPGGRLSTYQYNLIVDKCLAEAVSSVQAVELEYLQVQEDHSRRQQLFSGARRLRETASALQILPLPEVRPLLEGAADYLLHIAEQTEFPPLAQAESFARLLVNVELYLDPALQRQPAAAQLLLLADTALDELQEADADYFDGEQTQVFERSDSAGIDLDMTQHDGRAQNFITDALQSLDAINRALTDWKQSDKVKHLLELQHEYRKLDNSSRSAAAFSLSRLAAANERLLDGVILSEVGEAPEIRPDSSVMMRPSDSELLVQALDESVAVLPQLINVFPAQGEELTGLEDLLQRLEQAATGEMANNNDEFDQTVHVATAALTDESFTQTVLSVEASAESQEVAYSDSDWLEKTVACAPPEQEAAVTTGSVDSTAEFDTTADLSIEATQFIASEITGGSETSAQFDNTLMKVFFGECERHISLLKEDIGAAFADGRLHLPTAQMQRSLHTLHGSAQTADVPAVIELVAPLDRIANQRLSANLSLDRDQTLIVSDAILAVEQIIDALATGQALPNTVELQEQLSGVATSWMEDDDDNDSSVTADLQGLFVEEAGEILAEVHADVAAIRDTDDHAQPLTRVAGALHTLKGSARVARFYAISDLTHALENALSLWKFELPLSAVRQDMLQQVVDAITLNLEQAQSGGSMGQFDWLIAELNSSREAVDATIALADDSAFPDTAATIDQIESDRPESKTQESEPVEEAARASVMMSAQVQTQQTDHSGDQRGIEKSVGDTAADDTMVVSTPFTHRRASASSSVSFTRAGPTALNEGEQIRLDSTSVARLSDLSTEVSIQQARVNEHFHSLRQTLVDLDKTTDRLRYKLRELQRDGELELPLQTTSAAVDHEEDATTRFDPLELERYTRSREDTRQLNEVLSDFDAIRSALQSQLSDAEEDSSLTTLLHADIQQSLMRSRLVRFGQHSDRLGSVVRQTSSALDKQVDWVLNGGEIEIDRGIHKALIGPLEHLIRNAISHGVESAEERIAAGKPPLGMVTLDVAFEGTDLVVCVRDDGAGVNVERIRARLKESREFSQPPLAAPIESMSEQMLLDCLFEAGFSTSSSADQYSGRGVGLDVVARAITELEGRIAISTQPGLGTELVIRIPQRVVINQVVLVHVGSVVLGLPVSHVHTVQAITGDQVDFGGTSYQTRSLAELLDINQSGASGHSHGQQTGGTQGVLIEAAGQRIALQVDDVPGYRELIARPLGVQLASLGSYVGGGLLPSGRSVLIPDLDEVVRAATNRPARSVVRSSLATEIVHAPRVLVVDDSVTMRTYAGRMLTQQGCEVTYARDGLEALESLSAQVPDLILLDVEMPRMNGFDFLASVRSEPDYADLPVVMVTSRAASIHRQRASELNTQGYLVKPYRDTELLRLLHKYTSQSQASRTATVN